jgi:hypothetical protein
MKTQQKRQLAADLLAGRKNIKDLQRPGGVVILHGDKCRINTALGEQEVTPDQLERIRGEEQVLIFLPENNR